MNENRNGESSERETEENEREQISREKIACSKQARSDSSDSKSEHEHAKSHREGRRNRDDSKKEKDRRRHHRRRRSRSHSRHRHKRSRHHGSHKSKYRHHRESSSRHSTSKHRRRRSRSKTRSRSRSRTPSPPRMIERREESPRIKREPLRIKAMEERMKMLREQAEQITGVEVPKYYNPTAVNPLKVAEIEKKKKLLWGKKEKVPETKIAEPEAIQAHGESVWASAQFSDNSCQEKFRKLMGMKGEMQTPKSETSNKQTELFNNLDKEYALARMSTHTHRGVGLGFASYACDSSKKDD
ncbi:DgyrCDS9424 [Dimorphilus gyrociliatus]|uniref:DgyrCDS9424 n=1 Tax=Dimorphilus gyrociliatus TaxID=2664684 RepID=A0A7I8VY99_9ANNE|nr:DgyrCDS9424 [Dimorphilus gyrociliatus]